MPLMNTFESIGSTPSLREVINEWRTGGPALDAWEGSHTEPESPGIIASIIHWHHSFRSAAAQGDWNAYAVAGNSLEQKLHEVATSEKKLSDLLEVKGSSATQILDALQAVCIPHSGPSSYTKRLQYLDFIPEQHPRRRGAMHLLIKLAYHSQELPTSIYLNDVTVNREAPCMGGGFADVYRGFLDGRPVAVKNTRGVIEDPFARKVCP
jgi:hypothetical protein